MSNKHDYVESLNSFKKRKGMYVRSEDLDSVANLLGGFMCAVVSSVTVTEHPNEIMLEIGEKRGWKKSACGPIYHIGNSNLSEI